ncbi:MAG: diaminopimelate epimerase [Desulfovibrio sp.]|jgi:diaminopimelate epimerase|nr:diaminopimelate epimerase [Desulfovibrio sp.]
MGASTIFATLESLSENASLPDRLAFTKMQGLGNDYIYVEEFEKPFADPGPLAVALSDRHFGIGSDGLVLIGKGQDGSGADFRMRIFNSDGSEAEMCGNASRCIGKYLYEKGLVHDHEFNLETLSGVRKIRLYTDGARVSRVCVDMGQPRLAPADLPMRFDGENFIDRDIMAQGRMYRGTAVSMGNPHLVVPVPGLDSLDLSRIGPLFEHHALFPCRVNTEFIQVAGRDRIRMRVWERGSGETLACGTGACAVLVACALNKWTGRKALVELPGGELEIEWADDNTVYMTGEAAFICSGEYFIRRRPQV